MLLSYGIKSIRDRNGKPPNAALQVALALTVLSVSGAHAASDDVDPFSLSPEQLFDTTVMSVSKSPEKLGDAAAAIYVLTNTDIMRSGATSIPEALRLVPGVQVARVNTSNWAISVRGFGGTLANKLLVLIDGREVYDPLFSGVYWDIQDTPLEDIDRIEVIRGPGASLWGANAVNGVINIITKSAAETKGALVSVVSGNQENALVTARYGGDAGKALHWRVYSKYLNRASQETLTGADAGDEWQEWRGGFRMDSDRNAGGSAFTLQSDIYHSESGQRRSMPQLRAPYAVTQEESISASGGNLLARWTQELGNQSRLSVQGYVDVTQRTQIPLEDQRTTADVDAQYEPPPLAWNSFILGLRYRYTVDNLTATPIITFAQSRKSEQRYSGFIQDKITLEPERWVLTLGSKFEHNEFTGFEIQPSARLQWMGDHQQMAWASISRAVRTPSELERDLRVLTGVIPPGVLPLPISVELVPSASFESEELTAYELGYRRQWTPNILTDVSVFYNDYDKLSTYSLLPAQIVFAAPAHIVLPIATTNMTTAKTSGFEAVLNWRAAKTLNLSATYSFLYINLDGPPSAVAIASEAAEKQSPRQQWNLHSQWDVSDKVAFDTTLYYVAQVPGFAIDAYWRLDARVGWHVTDNLQFELVGQDLFDGSHREFGASTDVNATQIGRSIYGKLTWRG